MNPASPGKSGTIEQARQPLRFGLALWAAAAATLAGGIAWFGAPAILDPGAVDFIPFPAALALFFAAMGTVHFAQGFIAKLRFSRDGASTLDAAPAVLGRTYRGRIRTERALAVSGPYTIRLLCESRDVRDNEGGRSKPGAAKQPVWTATVQAAASVNSTLGIPFEFKIPADGLPNRYGSSVPGYEIYWTLRISAPMKGLHYRADFPIDVAATASRSADPDEDEAQELAAARRHARMDDAFAGQIRPESARARMFRHLVPLVGILIFAAGSYSTWNQYAYGRTGEVLSGRISAINLPTLDVALDNGEVARIARVTKYNSWSLGQAVEITCPSDPGLPPRCRMNTGSDRWIDALGTLAVGTAVLLVGAWLWVRRARGRRSRAA